MKALVLAAGYGERLRPLTAEIPKPLLQIGGRPLIHYPLLLLRHAGIREVAVNVHHLADKIEGTLGSGEELGLMITYSPESILLGTGGPLLQLRGFFGTEPFLILNGDTIMDLDVPAMITSHRQRGAVATMALRETTFPAGYSQIEIDGNGQIRRMRLLVGAARGAFEDYPDVLAPELHLNLTPLMYCGAMICEPAVYDMIPAAPQFSLIADALAPMVSQRLPVFGHLHQGFFRTVDDLEGYERLRVEFIASPPPLRYIGGR
jgi:mannose-1-phosphate guanylyltransferase